MKHLRAMFKLVNGLAEEPGSPIYEIVMKGASFEEVSRYPDFSARYVRHWLTFFVDTFYAKGEDGLPVFRPPVDPDAILEDCRTLRDRIDHYLATREEGG